MFIMRTCFSFIVQQPKDNNYRFNRHQEYQRKNDVIIDGIGGVSRKHVHLLGYPSTTGLESKYGVYLVVDVVCDPTWLLDSPI